MYEVSINVFIVMFITCLRFYRIAHWLLCCVL